MATSPTRGAGGDEIVRPLANDRRRPGAIDRALVQKRRDHLRRETFHHAVGDDSSGYRQALPRPGERARRTAERTVGQRRCPGRCHRRGGAQQRSPRPRPGPVREPPGDRAGGGNEQRRISAEQTKRAEIDEERRRHHAAVFGGDRLPGECGYENRRQDQSREFAHASGLRPACQPQSDPCTRHDGGKDHDTPTLWHLHSAALAPVMYRKIHAAAGAMDGPDP